MTERLLVVGGDAAGMTAAAAARRLRRDPADLEIVAFERGEYTSYAACGIPYYVADLVHTSDALVARSPEEHRRRGVDARTGHEVVAIDVERKLLTVRPVAGDGEARAEPYDALVIATGATPTRPPLPGIDAAGIHGVQHLPDGLAIRAALDDEKPRRAVVVGGGYIGLEMAEALVIRGLDVTIVEAAAQPMPPLDPDMAALVSDAIRAVGIDLRLEQPVRSFAADDSGHVRAVVTDDGEIPADIVILGLGVRPNGALAREAGIVVGATGGITTDERMATSAPDVYAAGDCVETRHRVSGRHVAIALGTHANKQGVVAGVNASGGAAEFPGVLGTAVSKICAYEVAVTGLNERDAVDAGFDVETTTIDATTRAGYYPNTKPIRVKLVVERGTGRLLGAQVVGQEGAAKRIDVLATCIWNEMVVRDIASLDLGYAPPFSPVWDPVLVAARSAASGAGRAVPK